MTKDGAPPSANYVPNLSDDERRWAKLSERADEGAPWTWMSVRVRPLMAAAPSVKLRVVWWWVSPAVPAGTKTGDR